MGDTKISYKVILNNANSNKRINFPLRLQQQTLHVGDGIEYESDTLETIYLADAKVTFTSGVFENYSYFLKDHLGSSRAVFKDDGNGVASLISEHHTYPYGLAFEGNFVKDKSTKRLFNFKEKVSDFGLGWSDFGRRWYLGGEIPIFLGVDPISEKFPHLSVYNYASLNPVTNIDLHGLQGMAANAARDPKVREFVNQNPETAAAIAVGFIAAPFAFAFAAEAGAAATVGFLANEIKDEILSQATGGASDVLDATKMGEKLLKEGSSMIFRAVSKGELNDIKDSGLIRPGQGSMENKLFTDNVDDAIKQGENTGKEFSIIQIEVPNSTMNQLESLEVDRHMTTGKTIAVQRENQELFNNTRGKVSTVNN